MTNQTLTQVQEAAVEYNLRAARPNDFRVVRKTTRIVRSYCEAQGYPVDQVPQLVRDMWDTVELERFAMGQRKVGNRWVP